MPHHAAHDGRAYGWSRSYARKRWWVDLACCKLPRKRFYKASDAYDYFLEHKCEEVTP